MAGKYQRLLKVAIGILLMACALVVIAYYWMHTDARSMRVLPMYIMVLLMAYLLLQVSRRRFFRETDTWDNLYYIGLLTVILPVFLVSEDNRSFFNLLTDIGSLFLVVPILIRMILLMRKPKITGENKIV